MPASGMLFANDHDAGRTFKSTCAIRCIRKRRPRLRTWRATCTRTPTCSCQRQRARDLSACRMLPMAKLSSEGPMGTSGGLVEIDDRGNVIRSASNADRAFPDALLTPYGLVVVPDLDRVVSTNSLMHLDDIFSGITYQVWLVGRILQAAHDVESGCGREPLCTGQPAGAASRSGWLRLRTESRLLDRAAHHGDQYACAPLAVRLHVSRQLVRSAHHRRALLGGKRAGDPRSHRARPCESGQAKGSLATHTRATAYRPHWTAWDAKAQRLIVTSSASPTDRLYLLKLDPASGALSVDDAFRDQDGRSGFSFAEREWPHGWKGAGTPHGAVASR